MKLLIFLFICFSLIARAQPVKQMSFDRLMIHLNSMNDSMIILNFWATWCKPCVEELPSFEKLSEKYSEQKVKVILANLDFNSKVLTLVEPFVKNKKLKSEIIHITDTDPNTWINRVDSSWSGAIPATIIYTTG